MGRWLKRQISEDEKKRVLEVHGRKCFINNHEIGEDENLQFDHIKAFAQGGESEVDNIAPVCETHNKQKGQLPLYDFRVKLMMNEFFEKGDTLTLQDELQYLKEKKKIEEFGLPVHIVSQNEEEVEIEVKNKVSKFPLNKCKTTGWSYFYATLPVEVLNSDDDKDNEVGLQPRYLIFDKVFNLFRHFQSHPVLQPSICRFHKNKVLVFDGQHKIAGLLWDGRKSFELKIYLDCDPDLLNKTNIDAHDKFAQTRFYSSIMVAKLGSQFGKEFEEFKNLEDDQTKTEASFVKFLREKDKLTKGDVNKRFRSFLYNSVLDDDENKISRLINKGNRGSAERPLTMDMLEKSLFINFLYREPVEHEMTSASYLREEEIKNMIQFCNILDEEALHAWSSEDQTNSRQLKLNRMFRSKSIMSWAEILKGAICATLDMHDDDDRVKPFYRKLSDTDFDKIRKIIRRLVDYKLWDSPDKSEIDRVLADNKSAVKDFFRAHGLTTGYLMGAPE
ncbi:HNH endonuclease [Halobacteriovorax marinus]|uniref:HNH endonuclease n=1 Tax=Halobacteriovorax marinus TaxID=97084 RepID=UPI003A92F49F